MRNKKLSIGFDLRALQTGHEFRGIGAHTRSFVETFVKDYGFSYDKFYFYFYDTSNPLDTIRLPENFEYEEVKLSNPKKHAKKRSKLIASLQYIKELVLNHSPLSNLPNVRKLDIFIQFDQALGLPMSFGLKKYLFVYDLIPLIFKKDYLKKSIGSYRSIGWKGVLVRLGLNARYKMGLRTIKKANKIIVNSDSTRIDLMRILKIKSEKIILSPCSLPLSAKTTPLDLKSKTNESAGMNNKEKLIRSIITKSSTMPYMLYVGGVEVPRRRLDDLVGAYHLLRSKGINVGLVLVGREFRDIKLIPSLTTVKLLSQASYKSDVHMLGYVEDNLVDELYAKAKVFVFPTLYEGFGLPILEAFAKQCPIITYNNSSIKEVGGDAAIYCESSMQGITDSVEKLLSGETKVDFDKMNNQLSKFSWEKSVKIVADSF